MVSQNGNNQPKKRKFQLYRHSWLALLAMMMVSVLSIILSSIMIFGVIGLSGDSPAGQFVHGSLFQILTSFIFIPFVLHLPKGKSTFRQYLDDIGLSRIQPFFQLVLLALSCYVILALSQATASIVYRLFEGLPVNVRFIQQVFNLSGDLPPRSHSLVISIPSIFEELVFRGVVLTVFLHSYSERRSIIFSSAGFGLMHLMNLTMGRELIWIVGQVFWAFLIGLFYGYVFVRTRSLLPSMIVHYLGNLFIGSLVGYMQNGAPTQIEVLYQIILSFGVVPVSLMILWTLFYTSRWMSNDNNQVSPDFKEIVMQQHVGLPDSQN